MSPERSEKPKLLLALLHVAFFVSGISTVLIGQVLPILLNKLALDDAQASYFFTWQFSGSIIGTGLTNQFGKKGKFLTATVLGCFFMALGIVLLNADSYQICLFGFFFNGIGIGLTLPSINMLILEFNTERASSALSILNFFWGIGAIISQPFIDFFTRGTNILTPTLILSSVLALVGVLIIFQPSGIEQKNISANENEEAEPLIWTRPLAWTIALFNFIHVGFESAMGGWLKTYTQRVEGVSLWFPPIFLYFLFFVVGRGVAPVFFRFLNENKMIMLGLIAILGGMIILLSAESASFLSLGASLSGFGTSWIFPTNISRFSKIFGATATRRATPLFICGTIGSMFTTWLIGYISSANQNDLRSGMFVLLASVIFLIIVQSGLSLRKLTGMTR
ncbi:MAG TPA: MFS transporter [Pyrinomonadaceae bacterium]|nr:MFS transporter [Pyrinomonadaceae bacterium]